jgi:hypothetical protein
MSTALPAKYFGLSGFDPTTAGAGRDLLGKVSQTSAILRPAIQMKGGKRWTIRRMRKQSRKQGRRQSRKQSRKQRGGFVPSIGEGFAMTAAKYATPVALYGLFKFIRNSMTKRRTSRRTKSKTRRS